MHAILATWGWIILGIFFLTTMYFGRNKFGVLAMFFVLAGTLYYTAGFNSEFFNPKELHLENLLIFLTGVMVGGWGWVILALLLCAIFPLVENERESWAFVFVVASAAVLYLVTGWNLFLLVLYHPFLVIPVFIFYVGIGIGWALWKKWPRFIDKAIEKMERAKKNFIKHWAEMLKADIEATKRENSSRPQQQPDLRGRSRYNGELRWEGLDFERPVGELETLKQTMLESLEKGTIPDDLLKEWFKKDEARKIPLSQNKERFLNWVMFWPWSMLAYLLFDFIKEVVERIWQQLAASLQAVIDRKYEKVDQRLIKKPTYE